MMQHIKFTKAMIEQSALMPPCDCTPTETPISVTDTATLDLAVSGVNNHTVTGNVRLSATAGNDLTANPDGLYTPVQTSIAVTDTPTVNLTASGTANHNIQADVIISPDVGNTLVANPNGLYATGELPPLYEDCDSLGQLSLNGMQYLAANVDGTGLDWYKVRNPDNYQLSNALDVVTLFNAGKTVHFINSVDDTLVLSNHPDLTCSQRDLWIKNISQSDLVVSATGTTIDGQASITLPGIVALTHSGGAIHLTWSSQLDQYFIVGAFFYP